jgi:p-aminobenzoyl-glutamate transporter AbgT
LGNALPDPALIFVSVIVHLMAMSAVGAAADWSV